MVTKVQLQICFLLGLVYFTKAQLLCPTLTIAELGNTTDLSTEGLLARSIETGGETGTLSVPVKINNYKILCDASGSRRDRSSYVSVLIEFQCSLSGGTGNLAQCDGMTNITRQYQYKCSISNVWENPVVVQTLNPSATFQTEPANQCRLCGDPTEFPSLAIDPETHCLSCAQCDQGQGRCYIDEFMEQCCNFYLEGTCLPTECPTPLVPNNTTFDCGCTPLNLPNGSVSYSSGLAIGSTATHDCDFGYQLSGEDTRNCTAAGWTSGQDATCELIQCPELSIDNGMVVLISGDRTLNSGATYSCLDGYRLQGNSERFCQMDSMWNGTDPVCELIQCSELSIENGDVVSVPPIRTLNSRATYSCLDGYRLQGNSERFCQMDSMWNGTDPVCELIQCSELSIENGDVVNVPPNRTLNSRATYSCFNGYKLQGNSERSCQMDSTWSGTDPVCELIQCSELSIENGEVVTVPLDRTLNSRATYSCSDGYRLQGNSGRSCQMDGTWSGTDPMCELIECPTLAIDNGRVVIVPHNRTLNSTTTYSCTSGYSLRGNGERFCQMDGTWSGTDPECELIQCPLLDIDNGMVVIEPTNRSLSSMATYSCSVGYNLQGNSERLCKVDGTWSGTDPECVQLIQCPELNIENGDVVIVPTNRSSNSRATYSCSNGYSLQGNDERVCQMNGTWSGADPECELIQCSELSINNGNVVIVPDDRSLSSRADYSCSDNYRLQGNSERICQMDGTWSGTDPVCEEIQCRELAIQNGEVMFVPDSRSLNSKAIYSCTDGYRLRGESERSCLLNSSWSGTEPVCELIQCPELNFINGMVVITPSSRSLDAKAIYKCSNEYNLVKGNSERFCQVNSTWNGTEPVCVLIQCPSLSVDNGVVDIYPKYRSLNSKATYSCFDDYSLKGIGERFCQVNGTWSGIDIVCEKKSNALSAGTVAGIVIAAIIGLVAVVLITTIVTVVSVNACRAQKPHNSTPKVI